MRSSALFCPVVALFFAGCAGEPQRSPAELLRAHFPEQAEPVLRGAAQRFGLDASLPAEGSAPIVVRAANGFEAAVTELGAFGEGTAAEEAVAYRRAGGTSFWTATADGFEEWLLF